MSTTSAARLTREAQAAVAQFEPVGHCLFGAQTVLSGFFLTVLGLQRK